MFYKKSCSQKFRKIHRKTPAGLFAKFLRIPFLQNTSGRLILTNIEDCHLIYTANQLTGSYVRSKVKGERQHEGNN